MRALILSVLLNGVLLCVFFYFMVADHPIHCLYPPRQETLKRSPPVSKTLLQQFHCYCFDQLITLLEDERIVAHGYQVRDFALGVLAMDYDLDVERGVGCYHLARKEWKWGGERFLLFPGLKETQFSALQHFVAREKWPFTEKGLFKQIEKSGLATSDPELVAFFCHTPPFLLLDTLFARSLPLSRLPEETRKMLVLKLALEGKWERFAAFYHDAQQGVCFSEEKRRSLLLAYVGAQSQTAAYLLLITDGTYASQQLNDVQAEQLLDLLTVNTHEACLFAKTLLHSPRADALRKKAFARLLNYAGKQ